MNKYKHHAYANLDLNLNSFKLGALMAESLHCPRDPISAK